MVVTRATSDPRTSDTLRKKKQSSVTLQQNLSDRVQGRPPGGSSPAPTERSTSRPGGAKLSLQAMTMALNFTKKFKDSALAKRRERERERLNISLENSYRMEPERKCKFSCQKVEPVVLDILHETLKDKSYDPTNSPKLACEVANIVNNTVKDIKFDRYKIISHVIIVPPDAGADLCATSRCLWDQKNDNFITVNYKSEKIFAVATVYGIYFE